MLMGETTRSCILKAMVTAVPRRPTASTRAAWGWFSACQQQFAILGLTADKEGLPEEVEAELSVVEHQGVRRVLAAVSVASPTPSTARPAATPALGLNVRTWSGAWAPRQRRGR